MLRVGPRSAGADPGPVCYRQGGTEPTVTDANVVLGRLNPAYFLGGEIALDVEGARRAIAERCAEPLGLDAVEAANGIVEIANAAMVNALHLISVQRGYDPRDFVLVGFGGAGPVHANAIQRDCEIPTLVIPQAPGIFSATGLLGTDLKRDSSLTLLRPLEDIDVEEIERGARRPRGDRRRRARPRGRCRASGSRSSARSTCDTSGRASSSRSRWRRARSIPRRRVRSASASTPSTTASTASAPRPRPSSSSASG